MELITFDTTFRSQKASADNSILEILLWNVMKICRTDFYQGGVGEQYEVGHAETSRFCDPRNRDW